MPPTYSDLLWEEEERKRKEAGVPPTQGGPTLPELIWNGLKAAGSYLRDIPGPLVDPYAMEIAGGPLAPPVTVPPAGTGLQDIWSAFTGQGGREAIFKGDQAQIKVKKVEPKAQVPTAPTVQPQIQPPPRGLAPVIPQGPVIPPAPLQQIGEGTLAAQQEELVRLAGQYVSPLHPQLGEEEMSPWDIYNKRMKEREARTGRIESLLRKAYPKQTELYAEAYGELSKVPRWKRVAWAIASGNILKTDELANAMVTYESVRREKFYNKLANAVDADFAGKEAALDELIRGVQTEKITAKAMLDTELKRNPILIKNKQAMIDWAVVNRNMTKTQAAKFVEDSFDQKTGNYNVTMDSYTERLHIIKNTARIIKELTGAPDNLCIAGAEDPVFISKFLGDEVQRLEMLASNERDMGRAQAMRERAVLIKDTLLAPAKDETFMKILKLKVLMQDPTFATADPEFQNKIRKEFADLYVLNRFAPPGSTAESIARDNEMKNTELLYKREMVKGAKQELELRTREEGRRIEEGKLKEEKTHEGALSMNYRFILDTARPQAIEALRAKKFTEPVVNQVLQSIEQDKADIRTFTPAIEAKLAARDENTIRMIDKKSPGLLRRADAYRQRVWNDLPEQAQKMIGPITHNEALWLADKLTAEHALLPEKVRGEVPDATKIILAHQLLVEREREQRRRKQK